jgi:nitrogenase molybdenum-iron protein NifN
VWLEQSYGVTSCTCGTPIGIGATDELIRICCELSGKAAPRHLIHQRRRLLDSLIDGHKFINGKRAIVYGEADLLIGIVSLLMEIGIVPVLCATGDTTPTFETTLRAAVPQLAKETIVMTGADFRDIETTAQHIEADCCIGHSKGYSFARKADLPLIRVGFPIHDRIGSQRKLHIGYRGAQQLFDTIVNTFIEQAQRTSDVGYLTW